MSKEEINKNELLKYRLKRLVECSTSHGLPSAVRSEHTSIRIFWLVCFLASLSFCTFITISDFLNYFEYNGVINTQVIRETSAEFPAVTFCNLNPIDYSKNLDLEDFILYSFVNLLKPDLRNMSDIKWQLCHKSTNSYLQYFLEYVYETSADIDDLFNIDDMLLSCTFNNDPCTKDDFVLYKTPEYGNCYTFNSGRNSSKQITEIRRSSNPGIQSGLRLELFVGLPDYLPCWITTNGAYIAVHNKSLYPVVSEQGDKIAPGKQTNLVVDRTYFNKLSVPYSNCILAVTSNDSYNSSYYQKTVNKLGIYIRSACVNSCASDAKNAANMSNCLLGEKTIEELRACFINLTNFGPYYEQCYEQCPEECSTSTLSMTPNLATYPTLRSVRSIAEKIMSLTKRYSNTGVDLSDYNTLRKSVLAVNVYYDWIMYTQYDEVADKQLGDLIGGVGGLLGLFLGMSVLTFLEIIELIYEIVYIKLFLSNSK